MRSRLAGFTLIEIMAALAILGLSMFLLLQTHYTSLRLFEESQRQTMIRELTTRALGVAETELNVGNVSGSNDFGKRYPGYLYRFDAVPVSDTVPYLYDLHVVIQGPNVQQDYHQLVYYSGG
ncbi:MAG TPA: prepilin-type N-terminal cleavage/methylation domain-containing protein [Candidatus Hydrogenedentes bacterium]|nr:prepilin-type N-terminal cleavage/methylation domain-containing protein [Candidatus Hydrogenedentota bacterium]HOL77943.1 prepilin-type N-terminal cleavage/methylation domain-containing protein [Candidatus Hydrogenedentota bacterium]HPO85253.1 prepilin-type N-terminal cleavage/methylation domain-containing protein [Candidatus Hydrogenedentota bacterium]